MRVLIADDSGALRRLLATHLAKWGYQSILARDGEEAWRILQDNHCPRLAIVDWDMPGIDGLELCRRVRARQEPYVYMVLLTGKERQEDLVHGLAQGADDYLAKPCDFQELEVRLRVGKRIVELQSELIDAREKLRVEATHDSLTGLLNRNAIQDILVRDFARAKREKTNLSVILVDLDHFKKINDTYGHASGDIVLCESAHRMRQALRTYDAIARYGGEEFLAVVPGCVGAEALSVAERLRMALNHEPVQLAPDVSLIVTGSFGLATTALIAGNQAIDCDTLVQAADAAMYRAKQGGRDRVEVAE